MMNCLRKGIILSLVLISYVNIAFAQSGWHPADFQLPTRWSKEVSPKNALPDYPRPQMVRKEWQNLNGLWDYAITDSGAAQPQQFEGKILVPYPVESALSGVKKPLLPNQQLWYQRTLELKKKEAGKKYLLHFGAVDYLATIYVNGQKAGEHTGGYQQFTFDITNYLQQGNNTITVLVWDPTDKGNNPHGKQVLTPQGIMYTATSGIWQTVWMETVPEEYITLLKMTPDVDNGSLSLTINTNNNEEGYTVEAKAKGVGAVKGTTGQSLQLKVLNAHLWSPDDPYLYDLTVKLVKNGKTVDEVKSYFGMRKIEIKKDKQGIDRIFLNNKFTYNLGVLDQGFWPDGIYTAPTDDALKFDIEAIKSMGFNTIRKHIKIEPARWYYWCDKLGMLVWQDMPYPANTTPAGKAEFEREDKINMEQLYDHPSIICWVLFNEGWNSYDQKRLTDWMKEEDPSRLIDGHTGANYCSTCSATPEQKWIDADMTDLHDYPGPGIPPALPGKARVLGEFGGIGVSIPGHDWNEQKGWGYIQLTPEDMTRKYEAMVHQLKKLETEGLSGSIYTQPFDVETEQNGLITYDRQVIKIPLKKIRTINELMVTPERKYDPHLKLTDAQEMTDKRYTKLLRQFERGKHDSASLHKLIPLAMLKKNQAIVTQAGNIYISLLRQPFSKENLQFINEITHTSKDAGFAMFREHYARIDSILGKNIAGIKIKQIIYAEEMAPYMNSKDMQPDWDAIQRRVTDKYGSIGKELVLGQLMNYYLNKADWKNFAKYYVLYFKTALTHSEWNINTFSWYLFQHVHDPKVLEFAADVSRYNVEHFDSSPEAYDTYANLLYETGKKDEAVQWEEKAVKLKEGAPDQKEYTNTLDKMRNGVPTWQEQ